jgi:hypothetical protein
MSVVGSVEGAVAQLGERLVCNQEATGSIPVSSTNSSSNDNVSRFGSARCWASRDNRFRITVQRELHGAEHWVGGTPEFARLGS